jgi:Uma2 family endonuclease
MLKTNQKPDNYIPSKFRYWVNGEWVEEDDMADSFRQFTLVHYLVSALNILLRNQVCVIKGNIFIYPLGQYGERVAPDVLVIKGISLSEAELDNLASWAIDPPHQPAPNVAIEVSSAATWDSDVLPHNKPSHYAWLGVGEYFAYDPLGVWEGMGGLRLRGWRRNVTGQAVELPPNEDGWIWSNELECWLVADRQYLRFYTVAREQILSEGEYGVEQEELRLEAEERAEAEQLARAEAEAKIEQERLARAEAERLRIEAEAKIEQERLARAEAERLKIEAEAKIEQERLARTEAERLKIEAEAKIEQERRAREELERRIAELQAKLNKDNSPQK